MNSDSNIEDKTEKSTSTTVQESKEKFTTNDGILAILSGRLVTISLLLAEICTSE